VLDLVQPAVRLRRVGDERRQHRRNEGGRTQNTTHAGNLGKTADECESRGPALTALLARLNLALRAPKASICAARQELTSHDT
jgi:hypothetical protein